MTIGGIPCLPATPSARLRFSGAVGRQVAEGDKKDPHSIFEK